MAIVRYNQYDLRKHNTFGMDVKAELFITYDTVDELIAVLAEIRQNGKPILHIGGGSNLLFTKECIFDVKTFFIINKL